MTIFRQKRMNEIFQSFRESKKKKKVLKNLLNYFKRFFRLIILLYCHQYYEFINAITVMFDYLSSDPRLIVYRWKGEISNGYCNELTKSHLSNNDVIYSRTKEVYPEPIRYANNNKTTVIPIDWIPTCERFHCLLRLVFVTEFFINFIA